MNLVAHKVAKVVSDRAIQLLEGFSLAGLGKLLINLGSIASFQSEAKYPKFVFDPNLAKLPGLRYPIVFAPQRT